MLNLLMLGSSLIQLEIRVIIMVRQIHLFAPATLAFIMIGQGAFAKSIETRVFGTSASIYMSDMGLELDYNSSGSIGSFWAELNPKWNMIRGVMEFPINSYTPFSNSRYRLDLKDVGGVDADDPVDNRHKVSWYNGDGIAAISDWSQSANLFSTITAPQGQTLQTIPLDVTQAVQSHGAASPYVGFRFEPASPTAFEDFGRTVGSAPPSGVTQEVL